MKIYYCGCSKYVEPIPVTGEAIYPDRCDLWGKNFWECQMIKTELCNDERDELIEILNSSIEMCKGTIKLREKHIDRLKEELEQLKSKSQKSNTKLPKPNKGEVVSKS